jgi:hypothetical protein
MKVRCDLANKCEKNQMCGAAKQHDPRDCEPCPFPNTVHAKCVEEKTVIPLVDMEFADFEKEVGNKVEGIVLLSTGGAVDDWLNGVAKSLKESKVVRSLKPEKLWEKVIRLHTSGGRVDLALLFPETEKRFSIGRMAPWRLRFCHEVGTCSWVSDYIDNYRHHH